MDTTSASRRVLILGGARSGKSAAAERRITAAAGPNARVTYVATDTDDRAGDDPDWAARVAAHRARRPPQWDTVVTTDLAGVLTGTAGHVLIDGLGLWLSAVMDAAGAWETPGSPHGPATKAVQARVSELASAWATTRAHAVAVSDEVGMGGLPATVSGRRFLDELGRLNEHLATASDEVVLVVAGRLVPLTRDPYAGLPATEGPS